MTINILGVFGGNALGVGYASLILPMTLTTLVAIAREIDFRHSDNPVHLVLLMFGGIALATGLGFAESRSFLYLAPIEAAILTIFFDYFSNSAVALPLAALVTLSVTTAIANLHGTTHPFKRNAAIPFAEVLEFVEANATGRTLVLAADPAVHYLLETTGKYCVADPSENKPCQRNRSEFASIFLIVDDPVLTNDDELLDIAANRHKISEVKFGLDQDAELKSWLTGVPLQKFILSIKLYR